MRLVLDAAGLADGSVVHEIDLTPQGLDIGRAAEAGWTLPDPAQRVSRRHCEIRYSAQGFWLRDLSTNGTFVNGAAKRLENEHLLKAGDAFTVGPYNIAVVEDATTRFVSIAPESRDPSTTMTAPAHPPAGRGADPATRPRQRKLAAILAADISGFSRLARAEEDRTLARLRALRSDLIDPAVSLHGGRVVKRTGDGFLAEFRSIVNAVHCAIELQRAMRDRNVGVAEDRRIDYRMGVHIGDVVEEDDGDLMGDGVNVASRIEGITPVGEIYMSEDAFRLAGSRIEATAVDMGPRILKNIAEPLRVFHVQLTRPGPGDGGKATQDAPSRRIAAPWALGLFAIFAAAALFAFLYLR